MNMNERLGHFGLNEEVIARSFKEFSTTPMVRYGRGMIAADKQDLFDALLEEAFRAGMGMGSAGILAHLMGRFQKPEDPTDGQ